MEKRLKRAERLIHVIRCRILDDFEGDTTRLQQQLSKACYFARKYSTKAENAYARIMWL